MRAHDDFKVANLSVAVSNTSGQEIERGSATETPLASGRWAYMATSAIPQGTTVRISVTVSDQPGGKGEAMVEKEL